MIAGRMLYKLAVYKPVVETNAYGEETETYEKVSVIHAERVKSSGKRSEEVGEHFPDYSVEFNIRYAHVIGENWQVEQLGEHRYTVTNVIPNLGKGYKTLVCERLNE